MFKVFAGLFWDLRDYREKCHGGAERRGGQ